MELLLLRHGHAERGDGWRDRERELTDAGTRDVQRIGVWLQAQGLVPGVTATPGVGG